MQISIQEIPQFLAAAGVAELAQGLGFDLADAFTGDVELLADLLQRAGAAILQAEAQAQDLFLTRGQGLEHVGQLLLQQGPAGCPPPHRWASPD